MSKREPIADRYQLKTDDDVRRYNESKTRQDTENERLARQRKAQADHARRKLSLETLAKYDVLSANQPNVSTLAIAERMECAQRSAEATAESYCLRAGGLIEALHLCQPFLQFMQKMAGEMREELAAPHMTGPSGEPPTGTTFNDAVRNLLESVVVYSSTRPGVRWVMRSQRGRMFRLDTPQNFADVIDEITADSHCGAASEPFQKSLEPFYPKGLPVDCVSDMAEHAAVQRDLKSFHRDDRTVSVGLLFPVAIGSDIVILKFCHAHVRALLKKYKILVKDCVIEHPWEGIGTWP